MARIRTARKHHRGWEPVQMTPERVAQDIVWFIRQHAARGRVRTAESYTDVPETIAKVKELLSK